MMLSSHPFASLGLASRSPSGAFALDSMRRPSGKPRPAKEETPAISHVSYSCLAKTTATENFFPAPTCIAALASDLATVAAQNSLPPTFSTSPSRISNTPPTLGRLRLAPNLRFHSEKSCFTSLLTWPTRNGLSSSNKLCQSPCSVRSRLTSVGTASASPSPSTNRMSRLMRRLSPVVFVQDQSSEVLPARATCREWLLFARRRSSRFGFPIQRALPRESVPHQ